MMAAKRHDKAARFVRGEVGSYSAGEWGRNRVRVFDRGARGLYLDYFDDAGKRVRTRLPHTDRQRAKDEADELAVQFRVQAARPARLTLATLFDTYDAEVSRHKPSVSKRKHDKCCREMFLRFFGPNTEARKLSRREWDRFILARRGGTLRPASVKEPRAVRDRIIEYDLKHLLAVLNWATVAGDGEGYPLLERNPLRGLPLPSERNPKRAFLSDDQYDAMLEAGDRVHQLVRPLLVLGHETGHRIGSIRQLRWEDIDFAGATVTWAADRDKEGRSHTTPLTLVAVAALTTLRRNSETVGAGWVFPSPADAEQPCSRHLVRDWWERSAKIAKLPCGERYGWHSLRRGFATAMRDVAPRDLVDLGGWASYDTPLKCYIRPDLEAQRGAFAQRRPLRASTPKANEGVA
jgi:integrase